MEKYYFTYLQILFSFYHCFILFQLVIFSILIPSFKIFHLCYSQSSHIYQHSLCTCLHLLCSLGFSTTVLHLTFSLFSCITEYFLYLLMPWVSESWETCSFFNFVNSLWPHWKLLDHFKMLLKDDIK